MEINVQSFLKELMDTITVEANNGDYYVDGYVDASVLDTLINKYFAEELGYEFTSAYTYSRWHPRRKSNADSKLMLLIQSLYNQRIVAQLNTESGFALIKNPVQEGKFITFPIKPTSDKKDDES